MGEEAAASSVVLTADEVGRVLGNLERVHWLIGGLLYGSGLRLMEAVRRGVKDVDFHYRTLTVRDDKGLKDRVVTLADELVVPLRRHMAARRTVFERDSARRVGTVYLPRALAREYPRASGDWVCQWLFATPKLSLAPRSGSRR